MKFKYQRVNIPNDKEGKDTVNTYLSQKYIRKGNLERVKYKYEDDRKCEKHEAYRTDVKVKKIQDDSCKDTAWDLFLNLIIGVKETAYYLAMSFIEGYGVVKDEFLMYLTMAIGIKLGDKKTIELVDNEPIPIDAQRLADKCLVQIKWHEAEVKNRDVSWEEIMARAKAVDNLVKKESRHSYCASIEDEGTEMKKWAQWVEPIIEDNYNYAPSHTTTATYIGVPTMGQTPPPAKEGCEIS